jgi:hypothetical protein
MTMANQLPIQLDYAKPERPKTNWVYLGFLFGLCSALFSVGLLINCMIEIGLAIASSTTRFAVDHAGSAVALLLCGVLSGVIGYFFIRDSR